VHSSGLTKHGSLEDTSAGTILLRNVYVITREGESMPLNERARGADLTGDGDTDDAAVTRVYTRAAGIKLPGDA
jgi:hypothetical protein